MRTVKPLAGKWSAADLALVSKASILTSSRLHVGAVRSTAIVIPSAVTEVVNPASTAVSGALDPPNVAKGLPIVELVIQASPSRSVITGTPRNQITSPRPSPSQTASCTEDSVESPNVTRTNTNRINGLRTTDSVKADAAHREEGTLIHALSSSAGSVAVSRSKGYRAVPTSVKTLTSDVCVSHSDDRPDAEHERRSKGPESSDGDGDDSGPNGLQRNDRHRGNDDSGSSTASAASAATTSPRHFNMGPSAAISCQRTSRFDGVQESSDKSTVPIGSSIHCKASTAASVGTALRPSAPTSPPRDGKDKSAVRIRKLVRQFDTAGGDHTATCRTSRHGSRALRDGALQGGDGYGQASRSIADRTSISSSTGCSRSGGFHGGIKGPYRIGYGCTSGSSSECGGDAGNGNADVRERQGGSDGCDGSGDKQICSGGNQICSRDSGGKEVCSGGGEAGSGQGGRGQGSLRHFSLHKTGIGDRGRSHVGHGHLEGSRADPSLELRIGWKIRRTSLPQKTSANRVNVNASDGTSRDCVAVRTDKGAGAAKGNPASDGGDGGGSVTDRGTTRSCDTDVLGSSNRRNRSSSSNGSSSSGRTQVRMSASAVSRLRHYSNPWVAPFTPIVMDTVYPDLPSFVAAVQRHATSWHPQQISAALNYTVKLKDALDRSRTSLGSGGTGDGGSGSGLSAEWTSVVTSEKESSTVVLRETLDLLYAAFMPAIPHIVTPRYAVNALWVCAKTGFWGTPGSGFVAALLQRLRDGSYSLLRYPAGQTHANLWWALSEYDQQRRAAAAAGTAAAAAPTVAAAVTATAAATAAPAPASLQVGTARGCFRVTEDQSQVTEGMDLLRMSASVIKALRVLDEASFLPQAFSNILLAAARLQYSSDPEFVDLLLRHMVKHPNLIKSQEISVTFYALGDLYGTGSAASCTTPTPANGDEHGAGPYAAKHSGSREDSASGTLPPAIAPHVRGLVVRALCCGLSRFTPQGLSNTLYGLVRIGLRMGVVRGVFPFLVHDPASETGRDSAGSEGHDDETTTTGSPGNHNGRVRSVAGAARTVTDATVGGQSSDLGASCLAARPAPASSSTSGSAGSAKEPADTPLQQQHWQRLHLARKLSRQWWVQEEQRTQQQKEEEQQHQQRRAWQARQEAATELAEVPKDPNAAARLFVVCIGEHVRDRLLNPYESRSFVRQDVTVTTWALASMGYFDQSFYAAAVRAELHNGCMETAQPQCWGIYLWSFVTVAHKPPRELIRRLRHNMNNYITLWGADAVQSWSLVTWALAALDLYDEDLVTLIARCGATIRAAASRSTGGDNGAAGGVGVLKAQDITNSLWALAVMPEGVIRRHYDLAANLVEAANGMDPRIYNDVQLMQLWQAYLELEAVINSEPLPTFTHGRPSPAADAAARAIDGSQANIVRAGRRRWQGGCVINARAGALGPVDTASHTAAAAPPSAASAAVAASSQGVGITSEAAAEVIPFSKRAGALRRQLHHLRLSPSLVAVVQEAVQGRTCRDLADNTTSFQQSVFRTVRWLMGNCPPDVGQQAAARTPAAVAPPPPPPPVLLHRRQRPSQQQQEHCRLVQTHGSPKSQSWRRASRGESTFSRFKSWSQAGYGRDDDALEPSATAGGQVHVVRVEPEWLVVDLGIRVDLCVWLSDGRQVVVEVDGPVHFFSNEQHTRLPRAALRNRQLARVFGWENVKCVPHWEWNALVTSEARRAYLARLFGLQIESR